LTNATTDLLTEIQGLASEVTRRAEEIVERRQIPADLIEVLRSAGVFRMFVPKSHGGLELDMPNASEILKALARINGSLGWVAMISNGNALYSSLLPQEAYERIYENGPDVIIAGSVQPAGIAEEVNGGWIVNGRWGFASGCKHAQWLYGFCTMNTSRKPVDSSSNEMVSPLVRGFFLPVNAWQIEDTWHAAGLEGTGSHHIALKNTFVPTSHFFDFPNGTSCIPGPLYQSVLQLLPLLHGTTSVGIAQGALDDLVARANAGHQYTGTTVPMRDSEIFQQELGRVAAEVRAADALHQVEVAGHWRHALNGTLRNEELFIQGAQTAIWLATTCARVADACFTLGGSESVYQHSPLQQRLRDLHVSGQHAIAHRRRYVSVGKQLLRNS
jgi:alkylation response protein AidB-like acyl-CoA dehydrogenase